LQDIPENSKYLKQESMPPARKYKLRGENMPI